MTLAAQYAPLAFPAIVYGLGIALSAAVAFAVVGAIVGRLMDRRTRRHQLDDEIAALDHNEPSRAQIEAEMTTPIFDALAAEDCHEWVRIELAVAELHRDIEGMRF